MSDILCCRECGEPMTYDEACSIKDFGLVCGTCFVNTYIPFDCFQCVQEVRECAS